MKDRCRGLSVRHLTVVVASVVILWASCWHVGADGTLRSIHAGSNWGINAFIIEQWEATDGSGPLVSPGYIAWLKSLHANWVGFTVPLHYGARRVERLYDVDIATASDEAVRQIVRDFSSHDINMLLALGIVVEGGCWWQLGRPGDPITGLPHAEPDGTCRVSAREDWPWNPDHPDHDDFVAGFWESYTELAVHFARITAAQGVASYSLGGETEGLFRTQPMPWLPWPDNHFADELSEMVDSVRDVYHGQLTCDMHYAAVKFPDHYPGSQNLWEDADIDVVGISTWFPLTDQDPLLPLGVDTLAASYEQIFEDYLIPLRERNPDRPIVLLEYGASDDVWAPAMPDEASFSAYVFSDRDKNGLDDGRETQANIFQAFHSAMEKYPGVVDGAFYWDNGMANEELWAECFLTRRAYSIRGKPAEDVVRSAYDRIVKREAERGEEQTE